MEVVDVDDARSARSRRGAARSGGGRPLRLRLPLLPRRHRHDRRPVGAVPADPGARGRGDDRRARGRLPRAPRAGMRVADLAGRRLRSLLPVPHRPRQRLRADLADGHPRRRSAAGAARPSVVAGLSRRRSRPGARPRSIEPVSIAVRAVARGRVAPGEHVVILGAGPIGQALALAATDRGASVLLVDRVESRLAHGAAVGADLLHVPDRTTISRPPSASGRAGTGRRSSSRRRVSPLSCRRRRAGGAGRPRGRRRALERARAGSRRRPAVQGDRRARDELLRRRATSRQRSTSSGDGAMRPPGWSPTSSRSSRRPRRSPTRSSIRPR